MLPSLVAEDLRASLTSFLGTTFALADDDVRAELQRFIADPHDGVFRGPYVRLKLPFRPADDEWKRSLDWTPTWLHPHRHQAEAWMRLASRERLPEPTLVTTGTGSGKTESFLVPLLDHCRRERARGRSGIKAIVLYPMNALANDQARRIAKLVHDERAELGDVTVGLYTGDSGDEIAMTETTVVEDKHTMRRHPPDVLLTNYKMLDMLLLRSEDVPLFDGAAESLRYLVLDEFHTYDGAQGTDVAMLLRRLGMALGVATDDRPLGAVTPVATSATLGGGAEGGPKLRDFAGTVFGTEFDESSLIGEDRILPHEWIRPPETSPIGTPTIPLLDQVTAATQPVGSHEEKLRAGVRLFFSGGSSPDLDPAELGRALRAHPFTRVLLGLARDPRSLVDLATETEPSWGAGSPQRQENARRAVALYLALLSHARADDGERPLLTIDVQLWLREVSRLLRRLSGAPRFRWFEGSPPDDGERSLPAVFCRHCGRSGWGVVATPGGGHATSPTAVWRKSVAEPQTARTWIYAPGEAAQNAAEVRWIDPEIADFAPGRSGRHGNEVPVLVTPEPTSREAESAARNGQCPACYRTDAIRFLGSRVATLASATLGQLFGSPDIEATEKKTLVFTDSVQDASHRATFVESRAYALNLRALVHRAIGPDGCSLETLGEAVDAAGRTPSERFAMLPPDLREHARFRKYWSDQPEPHVHRAVAARMAFSATLEFGLSSRTGRTLELTGTATAHVDVRDLDQVVRTALDATARRDVQLTLQGVGPQEFQLGLDDVADPDPRASGWARGVLERIRTQGGIAHAWLTDYAASDNRYPIWGGRPRHEGMPAFPSGRAAPAYPTSARHADNLDVVGGSRSWYSTWTARVLGVPTVDAHHYVYALFDALVSDGALTTLTGTNGSTVWQIPPSRVRIERTDGTPDRLRCTVCSTLMPGPEILLAALTGVACQRPGCPGAYRREASEQDYYRDLYRGGEVRRITAREHTSLLPTTERVDLETAFKASTPPPDAPNVLTCTPTLELGIDIGDLSMVALTSLPRSTASYLQRVGRAGRLTGNALVVSLLPARPLELQRLADPLTMIAGDVVPPACYLDATEILRRQYLASLIDRRARGPQATATRLAKDVFREGLTSTSWLGTLVADARANAESYVDDFLSTFRNAVSKDSAAALREWAGEGDPPGLERAVEAAVTGWNAETDEFAERVERLQAEVEEMEGRPSLDDAGKRELRRLFGELGALREMRSTRDRMYWISALEARGLLPNYTLLDDSTTLDIGLWWIDEESGGHESRDEQYVRGSRAALRELAPGATFYVRGTTIEIDGVDLGTSRNPATVRRRFCPACGWSRPVHDGRPAGNCPRCGAVAAGDSGQVIATLPFRRASAYASRERAMREDDRDERHKARFEIVTTVDADPADITGAWQLAGYPFGVEVLRSADVRWLNLGPADRGGPTTTVAGHQVKAPQFLACRRCGVVPAAQRGVSDPADARHRGWCKQRKTPDPNAWTTVALAHELRTQAVRMLVPPIVVADGVVRTSFRAALLLGLRQVLGGDPDHLDVAEATDPTPDGGERWTMVLHDLVPGGTGYLGRFADADDVHRLLHAALEVLEHCPCRSENVAACHRCLLPHAPPHLAEDARRETAIALLREIFAHWEPVPIETIHQIVVGPHDTPIEKRFRAVLVDWARHRGAAVTTTATTYGDTVHLRFPRAYGNRQWRLVPQVRLGGVQPDFVIDTSDSSVPDIAVFCDGRRYHCSPEHNRLADDADKRTGLRESGYLVWAVTHQDLDAFGGAEPPSWLDASALARARQVAPKLAVPGGVKVDEILRDPIAVLTAFLLRPEPQAWTPAAHTLAVAHAAGTPVPCDAVEPLVGASLTGSGPPPAGDGLTVVLSHTPGGAVVAADRRSTRDVRIHLGLDDRDATVGTDAQVSAWRDWLALGNILQFLEPGRFAADTLSTLKVDLPTTRRVIPPVWQEIADTWDGDERDLVLALATTGIPAPEAGLELDDGEYMIDLAWPDARVAVLFDADADTTDHLRGRGWTIVEPDREAVLAKVGA